MNLVDKEHVSLAEIRKQPGQISRFVEHRPRSDFHGHSQLIGNDIGEGGLPQPRRTVQQDVIQRFVPHNSGFNKDRQVFDDLFLSAKSFELLRPDLFVELFVGLYVSYLAHSLMATDLFPKGTHFFVPMKKLCFFETER